MFITRSAHKTAGQSPGTLLYVGEEKEEKVKIKIIDYNPSDLIEKEVGAIEDCLSFRTKDSVTWINITGIHDMTIIENLGSRFNLHPLLLEDCCSCCLDETDAS